MKAVNVAIAVKRRIRSLLTLVLGYVIAIFVVVIWYAWMTMNSEKEAYEIHLHSASLANALYAAYQTAHVLPGLTRSRTDVSDEFSFTSSATVQFNRMLDASRELDTIFQNHADINLEPAMRRLRIAVDELREVEREFSGDRVGFALALALRDFYIGTVSQQLIRFHEQAFDAHIAEQRDIARTAALLGGILIFFLVANVIYSTRRGIKGVDTILLDQQEAVSTQLALAEQLAIKDAAFRSTPIGMAIASIDGRLVHVNPAFVHLWGYASESEILGRAATEFASDSSKAFEIIESTLRDGVWKGEVYGSRKDGTTFPADVVAAAIRDEKGDVTHLLASFADIAERKRIDADLVRYREHLEELVVERTRELEQREDQLKEAQRIAGIGYWSLDNAAGELTWSPEVYRMHGRDPGTYKPNIVSYYKEIVHPEDSSRFQIDQKAFVNGHQHSVDYRILLPDGSERWLHSEGVIDSNFESGPRLKGIMQDITAQKKQRDKTELLERQLLQAQKMESLGQLTGGIAHDFNNMLASIRGFTDLALRLKLEDQKGKLTNYLNRILASTKQASDLVAQMLVFARKQGESVQQSTLSIPEFIDNFYQMMRPILPATINLEMRKSEKLPAIAANPVMLNQVLTNLCINAKDALPNGSGNISVEAKEALYDSHVCSSCHHPFNGTFVEIVVRDDGQGIPPNVLKNIFEPFYTTKDVNKGTGMGLAMVHGIVHKHGGHIVVNSTVGQGSAFHLLLPPGNANAESKKQVSETVVRETDLRQKRSHILLVDDENSITSFMQEFLEQNNYRVTAINSSKDALKYFEQSADDVDLVLTDYTMPELNGAQMAISMMDKKPNLPVLLCTGYSEHIDEEKARQLKIRAFLSKPIDLDAILAKISECLPEENAH